MSRVEQVIRRVDRFQQRHLPTAFLYGVVKKFGDDNAGVLASNLAYSAFGSIFPMLLLLVTILGMVLGHDPGARNAIQHSALAEFPVIGTQLGKHISALQRGSALAFAIALLGLLWSSTGLAQAGLFTMAQVWNLPGPDRPNYFSRLVRSFGFLAVLAGGVIVTTGLASAGTFGRKAVVLAVGLEALAVAVNVGQYWLAFRVLTPPRVASRCLWPGAVVGGIGWTVLQAAGGYLVSHNLRNASEVYGTFAAVLGLLAWVYLGVQLSIYAAEINSVLARRLWPRSMVQPPMTAADRTSLALQAEQNRRRPEEHVEVSFSDSSDDQSVPARVSQPSG
jgi:YihY family inner membrane protein